MRFGYLPWKDNHCKMNQLSREKRAQILSLLVEGNSIRSIERITGHTKKAISRLLVDAGRACMKFHDETVRNLNTKRVQADEIWAFVYAKEKNVPAHKQGEAGSVWTWTAIDADSKLMISWLVGERSRDAASQFMLDLSTRLSNRIQLTTDGFSAYPDAVDNAFYGNIDFAQLVKQYGHDQQDTRYSPPECIGATKVNVYGQPDPEHVSTSYVERQNLTMRMHMRRFTRLTNGFSKKIENHAYAIALHFVYYNWCKIHKSLRVTPAMEAGLTKKIWEIGEIVSLVENERGQERQAA